MYEKRKKMIKTKSNVSILRAPCSSSILSLSTFSWEIKKSESNVPYSSRLKQKYMNHCRCTVNDMQISLCYVSFIDNCSIHVLSKQTLCGVCFHNLFSVPSSLQIYRQHSFDNKLMSFTKTMSNTLTRLRFGAVYEKLTLAACRSGISNQSNITENGVK